MGEREAETSEPAAAGVEPAAPPRRIAGLPAVVPPRLRPAGAIRAVTLEFEVTAEGVPVGIEVIESGGPELDAAFLRAVRRWRYAPAVRDGLPVRVRWRARQLFGGPEVPPRPPGGRGRAR